MPTRYPGGVTNVRPNYALSDLGYPDPNLYYLYQANNKDWVDAIAASPVTFTATLVGSGSLTYADQGLTTGAIVLTTGASAADQVSLQTKGRVARADSSKNLFYSTSIAASSVVNTAVVMGLTNTDTSPIGAAGSEWTGVADGIFFYKPEGSGALGLAVRSGSSTILNLTSLYTLVFDTYARLSYQVIKGVLKAWVNNTMVVNQLISTFPAANMYQQMSVRCVTAGARALSIDYIMSAQER